MTIQNQQITSLELMERAGYRVFRELYERYIPSRGRVYALCGVGNNGGDGLVIARYLIEAGQEVGVIVVNFSENRSADMEVALEKLMAVGTSVTGISQEEEGAPDFRKDDLVIDAVFGIGLNRRPEDWVAQLFNKVNKSGAFVVSVDIPSGIMMGEEPVVDSAIIQADHTFTFELPKLPLLLPSTGKYTKDWSLIGIDQDPDFIAAEKTSYYYTDLHEMASLLKPRPRFSHKGSYGHVFVGGGSYGKIGASMMCAEAALTAGSGLVTALVPNCGYEIFQTAVPEVMCLPTNDERMITSITPDFHPDVVALGPGMGVRIETYRAMVDFLSTYRGALVLDADALNQLALHPEMWELLPAATVLTPHPGEFKRLVGDWTSDRDMVKKAMDLSLSKKVILVLKGAYTAITNGEIVCFNSTGNPGMATGGSGDVLTGIIASLIGQGYDPFNAARLGVFLHGLSADIAVRDTSLWSLTATDIIDYLGDAYLYLSSSRG